METNALNIMIYPDGRMDRKNAALYLGLSAKTLAMYACKGKGPRYIRRGRIFYFQNDLDEWLREAKKTASTVKMEDAA